MEESRGFVPIGRWSQGVGIEYFNTSDGCNFVFILLSKELIFYYISVVNQPHLLRQRCGNLCQLNKKTKSWNFLDFVTSEVTFLKSFSVRKLLDKSAFA